jgi:hypothetical protein
MKQSSFPIVIAVLFWCARLSHGAVVASEFDSDPVAEGWRLEQQWCDPIVWTVSGVHHQQLSGDACPGVEIGAQDAYRWFLQSFNGHPTWFFEYRVSTTGARSEIPGGAPTVVAAGNAFGVGYNATVSRDQVKFFRDTDVPVLFFDLEAGVPHTIRLELDNTTPPTYQWFVDGALLDEGIADGPFPARDASIVWVGRSWWLPTLNAWYYIRFGDIPADSSGDFDSNADIDLRDFYFFHECLANERIGMNGGPGKDAGPGCRWANMEGDGADVDLADFAAFQNIFDGGQ